MYDKLKKEYHALVSQGQALFQQNNMKPYTARLTKEKFKQMDGVEILPHSPFSPNAAPSDYGLFCSMIHFLRNQQLNTSDEMKKACLQFFHSKPVDWYLGQIWMLADRWQKIVEE